MITLKQNMVGIFITGFQKINIIISAFQFVFVKVDIFPSRLVKKYSTKEDKLHFVLVSHDM